MTYFKLKVLEERYSISVNNSVKEIGAIGLLVKRGKYGGPLLLVNCARFLLVVESSI